MSEYDGEQQRLARMRRPVRERVAEMESRAAREGAIEMYLRACGAARPAARMSHPPRRL